MDWTPGRIPVVFIKYENQGELPFAPTKYNHVFVFY